MDEVISSSEVPSVGDFQFNVIAAPSGFHYKKGVDLFVEGPVFVAANTNVLPKSAADGGFTIVRLDGPIRGFPSGPRYPAIYFPQGEFGYLYFPDDRSLPRAQRVRGSTVREFVATCRTDYNVLLRGVGVAKEGFFMINENGE
jgi:hypothetical protein